MKGADDLDMPANHKFFLVDKARQIKQRMDEKKMADEKTASESNEQSNFVCVSGRRDRTATRHPRSAQCPGRMRSASTSIT